MTAQFDSLDQTRSIDLTAPHGGYELSAGPYRTVGKRVLDTSLIILFAPIWATVMAVITILLVAAGQRPFYVQKRLGQNGRVFNMLKFRTMVPNAERVLSDYLSANTDAREEWERHQKLKTDPRITPIGRFLRMSSLDELPQLLNVIAGDMSLVGPRPMMVEQRELYPGTAYYSLRPGLTGPWQVSDRNDCEFRDRAHFDTHYASGVSLKRDVLLLIFTIEVVLRRTGY